MGDYREFMRDLDAGAETTIAEVLGREEGLMGYVFVMSSCYGCGHPFSYNPTKVPSININGVREPVCQACVDRANPKRIANGLAPIVPLPGAYEAAPEEEVF